MTDGAERAARFWSGPGALLAGLVYGLLVILMFPPVGLWPLAFVGIVPLALAGAWAGGRPVRAGLLAAAGVLPAWLFEQRWMIDVTALGYPLLAVCQALMTGAFVTIVAFVAGGGRKGRAAVLRRWVAVVVPVAWVGMECFKAKLFFTGYPWYLAAHPLIEWPVLGAPAGWIGTLGVSLLVAMIAGAVVALAHPTAPSRRLGIGMLAVAAGVWVAAGVVRGAPGEAESAPAARIAVVQTNVPQSNKIGWTVEQRLADWERFEEMTRQAAAMTPRPDLIVWPETMFPGEALNPEAVRVAREAGLVWPAREPGGRPVPTTIFADRMLELQRSIGVPMLVGAIAMDDLKLRELGDGRVETDFGARYNSVFLVSGGAVQRERYDKINLTPFGEVIPYVWRWPEVQQFVVAVAAGGMRFDMSHGAGPRVFEVPLDGGRPPLRLAAPICFEGTMPEVCRKLAYAGGRPVVDVLVNLSNDGWFNSATGGREQHLQATRWRTVELGLPLVRSVNTGISASVDRWGRRLKSGPDGAAEPARVAGVMVTEVPVGVATRGTLYGRTGDWIGWTALAGTAIVVLAGFTAGRRTAGPSSAGQGGTSEERAGA